MGTINVKLLLIKMHYFLMFGGAGGALPYVTLLGKSIGINGTSIGLSLTVSTFFTIISRPFFGSLVDCFRSAKWFLISLLFIFGTAAFCLVFIPPIPEESHKPLNSTEESLNIAPNLLEDYITKCSRSNQTNISKNCDLVLKSINASLSNMTNVTEFSKPWNTEASKELKNPTFNVDGQRPEFESTSKPNDAQYGNLHYHNTTDPSKNIETSNFMYESYQVWIFAILLISSRLAVTDSMCLSDVACYSALGERREFYGLQRLWGTIGWAVVCVLSGYLNDLATKNNGRETYSSGFYILAALIPFDLIILSKIQVNDVQRSKTMCRDVKRVFSTFEIFAFSVGISVIGFLSAITEYFEFLYFKELGASQTLMGTSIFVQCSVEVIFFLVTGCIVKKLGPFNCLICAFAAFTIRFGLLSIISNPWWVLAINTTHGVTFAVFHAAMTNFASINAAEGIEGTMLGIFGGLVDGLGVGTGSLISGVLFDKYGGRFTIRIASFLSLACVVIFAISNFAIYRCSRSKKDLSENKTNVLLDREL